MKTGIKYQCQIILRGNTDYETSRMLRLFCSHGYLLVKQQDQEDKSFQSFRGYKKPRLHCDFFLIVSVKKSTIKKNTSLGLER